MSRKASAIRKRPGSCACAGGVGGRVRVHVCARAQGVREITSISAAGNRAGRGERQREVPAWRA